MDVPPPRGFGVFDDDDDYHSDRAAPAAAASAVDDFPEDLDDDDLDLDEELAEFDG